MQVVSRIKDRYEQIVTSSRERSDIVDHAFRATDRYREVVGPRLAAAIAYYGFFATFALAVIGYSILGFLVDYQLNLQQTVADFLEENLPVIDADQITAGRGAAGVLGLVGLVLAGLAWVEALRSSQRLIWGLEQRPGNVVLRRGLDVPVLLVLMVLLGVSFALAAGLEYLLSYLPLARQLGWVLTVAVNLVLAIALLAVLPRLRISPRRLFPAAVAFAVGLFLCNTVGQLYFQRVQNNPAYTVVATAAGLLVYLYLVHQLVLLAATWAATSLHGEVVDLSAGRSEDEPETEDEAP
jgi:membrane protein